MVVGQLLAFLLLVANFEVITAQKSTPLEVYVVPHSHCDPGWWWPFEHYYEKWTRNIITSLVNATFHDPRRHFIWAEISYFSRWWGEASSEQKDHVRYLLKRGQLEFVTGGWVMHDEAAAHYDDMVVQLQEGLAWLNKTLGVLPKVGWAIDPFGHGLTTPVLFGNVLQYDGMVINRIHKNTKELLRNNKWLEFWWKPDFDEHPSRTGLLTHTLAYGYYDIPNTCGVSEDVCKTFDFERPEHIKITEETIHERAKTLVDQYQKRAAYFKHRHLLIPLGDDFKYKTAEFTEYMLSSYQKLFDYINDHSDQFGVHVRFSNLSSYFGAIRQFEKSSTKHSDQRTAPVPGFDANIQSVFPKFNKDFFPYSDRNEEYWTGFYTTRPTLKHLIRQTSTVIRNAEIVSSLSLLNNNQTVHNDLLETLTSCRQQVAINQHHDAVTGTARQEVVQDYKNRLTKCQQELETSLQKSTYNLMGLKINSKTIVINLDESTSFYEKPIEYSGSEQEVLFFNPVLQERYEMVELISDNPELSISVGGEFVSYQVVPVFDAEAQIVNEKFHVFFQIKIKPLAFVPVKIIKSASIRVSKQIRSLCHISSVSSKKLTQRTFVGNKVNQLGDTKLENLFLQVNFDSNGLLENIREVASTNSFKVQEKIGVYSSAQGGAYIFKPYGDFESEKEEIRDIIHISGPFVNQLIVFRKSSSLRQHIIRLAGPLSDHSLQKSVDINLLVDLNDHYYNRNLVVRLSPSFNHGSQTQLPFLFMDMNGAPNYIKRESKVVQGRPRIESNYFPLANTAVLDAEGPSYLSFSSFMSSSGIGCLPSDTTNGECEHVEIMIDRRLGQDDGRGLGEGIMDSSPFIRRFKLSVLEKENNFQNAYLGSIRYNNPVSVFSKMENFSPQSSSAFENLDRFRIVSFRPCMLFTEYLCLVLQNTDSAVRQSKELSPFLSEIDGKGWSIQCITTTVSEITQGKCQFQRSDTEFQPYQAKTIILASGTLKDAKYVRVDQIHAKHKNGENGHTQKSVVSFNFPVSLMTFVVSFTCLTALYRYMRRSQIEKKTL